MNIVYTVVLGGWDYLRPPEMIDPDARYLAFVDQPMPPCPPWECVPAYTPFAKHSRNSRLPKILPHLHFEAEYSIYHDANFCLKRSPEYLIDRYLRPKEREIAMFRHPCRTNIEQEAGEILKHPEWFPNVNPEDIHRQIARWKQMGSPDGLWAGGLIIRKHTEDLAAFNTRWWREFTLGCSRDQFSLPLARHAAGAKIEDIQGDIFQNDLLAFHWHSAWKDKADNPKMAMRYAQWQSENHSATLAPARPCQQLEDLCRG